jgi:hypothetical protein
MLWARWRLGVRRYGLTSAENFPYLALGGSEELGCIDSDIWFSSNMCQP